MKSLRGGIAAGLWIASSFPAWAQFEVVSVRQSTPEQTQVTTGRNAGGMGCPMRLVVDNGRFEARCHSLAALIAYAFGVLPDHVAGPDWLTAADATLFDVNGVQPANKGGREVPAMLQAALRERFHLEAHLVSKEQTVYALRVARSGLIARSAPDGAASEPLKRSAGGDRVEHLESPAATFQELADRLSSLILADIPVLDMTGVAGRYQLALDIPWPEITAGLGTPTFDPGRDPSIASAQFDVLRSALRKLGLDLEQRKGLVNGVVVDRANRGPSEN